MLKKNKINLKSINNSKIITFIGMMGTGKSKFGRLIAKNLSFNFYDIDLLIEQKFNNTIKTIFEEELKKSSLKVRVIERPGPKVQYTAMATNAHPREKCQTGECMICDTKGGGNCRSKEITYEITCKGCKSGYDGQSGRNGFTRGREHVKLAKSEDPKVREKSFMYRHKMDDHKGNEQGWEMKVLNKFPKKPLDRLVEESQNIIRRPKEFSLNSKTEYAQSSLVQVRFISDTKQKQLDKLTVKKALENDREKYKEKYKQVEITRTNGKIFLDINFMLKHPEYPVIYMETLTMLI